MMSKLGVSGPVPWAWEPKTPFDHGKMAENQGKIMENPVSCVKSMGKTMWKRWEHVGDMSENGRSMHFWWKWEKRQES